MGRFFDPNRLADDYADFCASLLAAQGRRPNLAVTAELRK